MTHKRYANKVDANQQSIIDDLEKMGFTIIKGHDDFLAIYQGRMLLVECKNPKTTLNKDGTVTEGAIKPSQIKLLNEGNIPYIIAWYTDDILAWFGFKGYKKKLCGHCWLHSEINSPICECEYK